MNTPMIVAAVAQNGFASYLKIVKAEICSQSELFIFFSLVESEEVYRKAGFAPLLRLHASVLSDWRPQIW